MTQWVYRFGGKGSEGSAAMRELLGGKGANLAEMASIGLPVPPGCTITTEVCTWYYNNGKSWPSELKAQAAKAIAGLEKDMGMAFGDPANPLLVSVRSGARVSMPGMMDTVLNLGLNDKTVEGLAKISKDERFAWDSYRRFIQMYGDVVLGVPHHEFEDILEQQKRDDDVSQDTEITAKGWKDVVAAYKELVKRETGKPFPMEPQDQLWGAIGAVFESWMTARAVSYRAIHDIPADWGTAVNVQGMGVRQYGAGLRDGRGLHPRSVDGENYFYGEYLVNAQGEDVVAGIRTPQALSAQGAGKRGQRSARRWRKPCRRCSGSWTDVRKVLEKHYRDMQDKYEFTDSSAGQAVYASRRVAAEKAHGAGGFEDLRSIW